MAKTYFYTLAAMATLALGACSTLQKTLKETDVDKRYAAAMSYYEMEDYGKAGIVLEDLVPDIYGNPIGEKVQFFYANSLYYQGQYELAAYYFKTFHDTYQRSAFAIEGYYMHAHSLYKATPVYNLDQSGTNEAISTMQDFMNRYPNSRYTEEASACIREMRAKLELKNFELAKHYQKLRRYKAAVIAYDNFRKGYPDSQYKEEALFRRIEAQSELARLSFDDFKKERYEEVISFYLHFIDRYPKSIFLKQAEDIYKETQKRMGELAATSKK